MKLRTIGQNYVCQIEGVFLTQEEYELHPAYHQFCHFTLPALFVTFNGESWTKVSPSHASHYALLEASEQEKVDLWNAGYRMLGLERSGPTPS